MPGGNLLIRISKNWDISMTGEVKQIAQGNLSPEWVKEVSAGGKNL